MFFDRLNWERCTVASPSFVSCEFYQCQLLTLRSILNTPYPIDQQLFHIDISDKFVVNIHLLAFDTVLIDLLFMHHDFFNQFIEDMGIEFCDISVFLNERQKIFHVLVDFFSLCDLR